MWWALFGERSVFTLVELFPSSACLFLDYCVDVAAMFVPRATLCFCHICPHSLLFLYFWLLWHKLCEQLSSCLAFSLARTNPNTSRIHLALRSEHFRAMLFGGMRESEAGTEIEIKVCVCSVTGFVVLVGLCSHLVLSCCCCWSFLCLPRHHRRCSCVSTPTRGSVPIQT